MRTLVQRLKRLWNTPVEFYGVDRPEPQAGPWHGLLLFVVLLVILGLLWLIRYLPERTYLVQLPSILAVVVPSGPMIDSSIPSPPPRHPEGVAMFSPTETVDTLKSSRYILPKR
jgi:hypothetical protein